MVPTTDFYIPIDIGGSYIISFISSEVNSEYGSERGNPGGGSVKPGGGFVNRGNGAPVGPHDQHTAGGQAKAGQGRYMPPIGAQAASGMNGGSGANSQQQLAAPPGLNQQNWNANNQSRGKK